MTDMTAITEELPVLYATFEPVYVGAHRKRYLQTLASHYRKHKSEPRHAARENVVS